MSQDKPPYLLELNAQQCAAVEYLDGPQLVIAGAGSGKTRVLTYKIMHLLARGHEPWRILALTFTNKAANEMRQRITAQVGDRAARRLWMGTFHSVFARLLRTEGHLLGYPSNFTIYDTKDSANLIKTIVKDMDLDEKVYKPSTLQHIISAAKNRLMSPDAYGADTERVQLDSFNERPRTVDIYRLYESRMRTANAMDFDDLLFNMYRLLKNFPDIRRHYSEYFSYILVDEYQDTNYAQHAIITLLTNRDGALCVVGDDAQSIYAFRGADISNILSLKQHYPTLRTFKLERNYRSTQNIVNASSSLIAHNSEQIPKDVYSENDTGAKVEVMRCYSDFEEGSIVSARIERRRASTGDAYDAFAILYRTNAQSRILEESLRRRNIPYRIYGGLSFFERKEVKDAAAYMRLSINPHDDEALKRIINVPARKIGATTLAKVAGAALKAGVSLYTVLARPGQYPLDVNRPTRQRLDEFVLLLDRLGDKAAADDADEVVRTILRDTGLMAQYVHDKTPENISKQQNLNEFLNYAVEFVQEVHEVEADPGDADGVPADAGVREFMARVSLATDADNDEADQGPRVTLMTIHAAKGLEFNNVFVVGVEEDLLPSSMGAGTPAEIAEERRLMYVAMTRAREFCMLTYAGTRMRNGQTTAPRPSRFLREIDPRYVLMTAGSGVTQHPWQAPPPRYAAQAAAPRTAPAQRTAAPQRQPDMPRATHHTPAELAEGMRIVHPKFGTGTITAVLDDPMIGPKIQVNFDNDGAKTLMLQFARFQITE